ncbi:MAG TPA: peptidase domain-containing ABC transporter [Vineibacter sp.]|nr:peptidase domain-containing ABC transporter [Vineibacter sp.]
MPQPGVAPATRPLRNRVVRAIRELLAVSCLINLLALATPLYLMMALNQIGVGEAQVTNLGWNMTALTVAVGAAYLLDLAARVVRGQLSAAAARRIDAQTSNEVMRHLLHLPYRLAERTASGVVAERVRQLDTVRSFLAGHVPSLIVDLGFALVFVTAIALINWRVGLAVSAALPLLALLSLAARRGLRRRIDEQFQAVAARTTALNEIVGNTLTVKALGLEPEMARRWRGHAGRSAASAVNASRLIGATEAFSGTLQLFVALAVVVLCIHELSLQRLSLGGLVAVIVLTNRAVSPLRQIAGAWHAIQAVRVALTRIDEMTSPPAQRPQAPHVVPAAGQLALEGVSFRYDNGAAPVLREIDLRVEAGSVLGIVGPSGSGKTTIAHLLQGLYAPTSGRVRLDGVDIASGSPTWRSEQIAGVLQDNQLFAGTIRDNIALGLRDLDPDDVVAVAKYVGAHRFIQRLPQQYETPLGERGHGLSAGQRQLLCVARALIRNPRLLVLDEATSALDPASEEHLLRALRGAARGRTIILVSHRLAPLAIANSVALVVDGRIERYGPPTEVMAYARIRMAEAARGAATCGASAQIGSERVRQIVS